MRNMKTYLLFVVLCCAIPGGYAQYYPGQRTASAADIPALLQQLGSGIPTESLLNLGSAYLLKPGEHPADLDSALLLANAAAQQAARYRQAALQQEAQLLSGIIYLEQRRLSAAKNLLPALQPPARARLQLSIGKHYSINEQGSANNFRHLDTAFHYAQAALRTAGPDAAMQNETLGFMMALGLQYRLNGKFAAATNVYQTALPHVARRHYPSTTYVLAQLSEVMADQGNSYSALIYAQKAEKLLSPKSHEEDHFLVNYALGKVYKLLEQYDNCAFYFNKILASPARFQHLGGAYLHANNYCACLRLQKKTNEAIAFTENLHKTFPPQNDVDRSYYHLNLGNSYDDLKQFAPAERHFLESIRYSTLAGRNPAPVYLFLGALYADNHQPEKARQALLKAESNLPANDENTRAYLLKYMAKAEAGTENYETAYNQLYRSKRITDSLNDASKEKHTQELEAQYQTQKKESELLVKEERIRRLNHNTKFLLQEAEIQQSKLRQAELLARSNEDSLKNREQDLNILEQEKQYRALKFREAEVKRIITIVFVVLLGVIVALLCWLFWSKITSNRVISGKNTQLQQLLTDKSWLLKEMHHRVKNNLHTVMSLLESQSAYLEDVAKEAVKNSQSRIYSMSLIHQKLYQSDDIKTIDMALYIPELINYLRESFSLPHHFLIHQDIDHAEFNVSEAVPLGLIVNEAITNSLKYAFHDRNSGEITIRLKATAAHEYQLVMSDNGAGLPPSFDINRAGSLGFKLIKGLSAQLDAGLDIRNNGGLTITVSGISTHRGARIEKMEEEFAKQLPA